MATYIVDVSLPKQVFPRIGGSKIYEISLASSNSSHNIVNIEIGAKIVKRESNEPKKGLPQAITHFPVPEISDKCEYRHTCHPLILSIDF